MEQTINTKKLPLWQFWQYFLVLWALTGLIYFLTENWILDVDVYRYSFEGKLPAWQLERILATKANMGLIGTLSEMIIWVVGLLFMAGWIKFGVSLFDYHLTWRQGIEVAMEAALIPLLAQTIKILWFSMKNISFTLIEYRDTQLLSLQGFFSVDEVPRWAWGILGSINLFELLYCALLVVGLKYFIACSNTKGWKLIGYIYGSLWLSKLSINILSYTILNP